MQVEHHFDFGSPNCYLAHIVIPTIEKRTGAHFTYVPILLGGVFKATNNVAPMVAFKDVKNKWAYQAIEMRRFLAQHHVDRFRMNPHFPVNTLMLMRGIVALQDDPAFMAYVDALFRSMWEDGKKMDDPEVVVEALAGRGLDGRAFLERAQDPAVKARLAENTERSVARGTFGAPTFYVGDEIYFGKDRLRDVEAAIAGAKTAVP